MSRLNHQLRITEIFHSLQGESITVGLPTVFVRLTGCPLRCHYCDTTYAFKGGEWLDLDNIINKVASFQCKHVCITGGEPLAQPGCQNLVSLLCEQGYFVSIETSGAFDISQLDKRAMIVMDLKTPASGESGKNRLNNLPHLKPTDQIKLVLCNRDDYLWARSLIQQKELNTSAQILFSPSWGELDPTSLANWIVEDKLAVRFQLQLHKILWNDAPGH